MYLGIIGSHEVAEIAGRNADVNLMPAGHSSRLDQIKIATEVKHDLTEQTTPVDGIGNSDRQ